MTTYTRRNLHLDSHSRIYLTSVDWVSISVLDWLESTWLERVARPHWGPKLIVVTFCRLVWSNSRVSRLVSCRIQHQSSHWKMPFDCTLHTLDYCESLVDGLMAAIEFLALY